MICARYESRSICQPRFGEGRSCSDSFACDGNLICSNGKCTLRPGDTSTSGGEENGSDDSSTEADPVTEPVTDVSDEEKEDDTDKESKEGESDREKEDDSSSDTDEVTDRSSGGSSSTVVIAAGAGVGGIALLAAVIFGCCCYSRKKKSEKEEEDEDDMPLPPRSNVEKETWVQLMGLDASAEEVPSEGLREPVPGVGAVGGDGMTEDQRVQALP